MQPKFPSPPAKPSNLAAEKVKEAQLAKNKDRAKDLLLAMKVRLAASTPIR